MIHAQRPRLGYAWQLLLVVLLTTVATAMTGWASYRSFWNLLWMVGLPVAFGLALNRGPIRRGVMATTLVLVSLLATGLVGLGEY